MHNALSFGRVRIQLLALKHDRGRIHDTDKTRQTLGSPTAGQNTHKGFWQAQLGASVIGHDTVVARQRHFEAATERQAINGRSNRLAASFQRPQGLVQAVGDFEQRCLGFLFGLAFQRAHAATQFGQVRTRAKGFLAGCDHRALDGLIASDLLHHVAHLLHHCVGEHVHGNIGAVESDQRNAVAINVEFEMCVGHLIYSRVGLIRTLSVFLFLVRQPRRAQSDAERHPGANSNGDADRGTLQDQSHGEAHRQTKRQPNGQPQRQDIGAVFFVFGELRIIHELKPAR